MERAKKKQTKKQNEIDKGRQRGTNRTTGSVVGGPNDSPRCSVEVDWTPMIRRPPGKKTMQTQQVIRTRLHCKTWRSRQRRFYGSICDKKIEARPFGLLPGDLLMFSTERYWTWPSWVETHWWATTDVCDWRPRLPGRDWTRNGRPRACRTAAPNKAASRGRRCIFSRR